MQQTHDQPRGGPHGASALSAGAVGAPDQSAAAAGATSGALDPAREELVDLMMAMQKCVASRLGPADAADWLRLDLTMAQMKVLLWLVTAGEQPMSQVARVLGVGLPAATNLVDKLVDAGMVEREHSASDRRVVLVRPTERGAATVTRLRQVHRDQMRRLLANIPDAALATVQEGIQALLAAAQCFTDANTADRPVEELVAETERLVAAQ